MQKCLTSSSVLRHKRVLEGCPGVCIWAIYLHACDGWEHAHHAELLSGLSGGLEQGLPPLPAALQVCLLHSHVMLPIPLCRTLLIINILHQQ